MKSQNNKVVCPKCNEISDLDYNKWPPEVEGRTQIIHYLCPNGHEFIIEKDLK